MKESTKRVGFLVLLLLTLGGASSLLAQGLSASLTGIVADQSKAVVPGAHVTLTQEGTGGVRRTVTNTDGYFSIVGIPSSSYTRTIEATGFQRWERTNPADSTVFYRSADARYESCLPTPCRDTGDAAARGRSRVISPRLRRAGNVNGPPGKWRRSRPRVQECQPSPQGECGKRVSSFWEKTAFRF